MKVSGSHGAISRTALIVVIVVVVVIIAGAGYAAILLTSTSTTSPLPSTTSNSTTSSVPATTTITTSSSKVESVTVGVIPTADYLPLYVAVSQGYFSQQGLNVTVKFFGNGEETVPAVAQGSVQIGSEPPVSLAAALGQGFNLTMFAPADAVSYPNSTLPTTYVPGVSTNALVVLSSSNITSWSNLVGKTVGAVCLACIATMQLDEALSLNGVNPSQVNVVSVAPPNWISSLEEKRVDAVAMFEPFVAQTILLNNTQATIGEFRFIGDDAHFNQTLINSGYIATSSWVNSNPTVVKKFVAGLTMGVQEVAANKTLAYQILSKYTGVNSQVYPYLALFNYPVAPVPASWLQFSINLGVKYKLLTSNVAATSIVDTTYMPLS
ncbi:MAG: ABC transporter substrate-binding protein [Nitrososphaerota archaeon]|nr:ABC transporter substrate-binding protein [Nitrososphaerota archaeon]